SFVMDLYEPLYVPRPVVEPELFASLRPQTYGQDLAKQREALDKRAGALGARRADAVAKSEMQREAAAAFGVAPAAPPANMAAQGLGRLDLQQGVQSLAQAADVGELFQYAIETPVDLPRQQSAMLSI